MRSILALVVLSAPAALAADDKTLADADAKAMIGKYGVQKAELGGKDITEPLNVLKFEVAEGGKYTASHGEEIDAGTFTLDPTKTPKVMDVKPTGGPLKGKLVKAIYKIDGDVLTICHDHNGGGDRPTAFESKPDTTTLLVAYKRAK